MVTTVRISKANYDKISGLAKASGKGIREVLDALLGENVSRLERSAEQLADSEGLKDLTNDLAKQTRIRAEVVDGKEYYCQACGLILDPEDQPINCPECGEKLDWGPHRETGILGWTLVGLALLLALTQARPRV